MKTFKQYLLEDTVKIKAWSEVDIDEVSAINYLNANCKTGLEAIKSGQMLYRGFEGGTTDFKIIDPSTGERTSRDSNNLYQLMFDASDALADYPKRSKSLICSTNYDVATVYGDVYAVFPHDDTKVAIAATSDLFSQRFRAPIFGANEFSINRFTKFFEKFLYLLSIHADINPGNIADSTRKFLSAKTLDERLSKFDAYTLVLKLNAVLMDNAHDAIVTYDEIDSGGRSVVQQCNEIENRFTLKLGNDAVEHFKKNGFKQISARIFFKLMNENPTNRFTAIASHIFTPGRAELVLTTYGKMGARVIVQSHEAWFSGPAMLISADMFKKILIELDKSDFPIHTSVRDVYLSDNR